MRLLELEPEWVSPPGRYGLGVVFACPAHGAVCRVIIFFLNPLDNWAQLPAGRMRLHRRDPDTRGFHDLTLEGWIHDGECWGGMIIDGRLVSTIRP